MSFRNVILDLSLVEASLLQDPQSVQVPVGWLQLLHSLAEQQSLIPTVQITEPLKQLLPTNIRELPGGSLLIRDATGTGTMFSAESQLFQPDQVPTPSDLFVLLLDKPYDLQHALASSAGNKTWWCQSPTTEDSTTEPPGPAEIIVCVDTASRAEQLMATATAAARWFDAGLHVIPSLNGAASTETTNYVQQLLVDCDFRTISSGVQLHADAADGEQLLTDLLQATEDPFLLVAGSRAITASSGACQQVLQRTLQQIRGAAAMLFPVST